MFIYKFIRALITPYYKLCYPTKIIGKENFVDGRAICACNHFGLTDSMLISINFFPDHLHALIKKEAFEKKFANKFLTKLGMVPVDRQISDIDAMRKVIAILRSDDKVLIYPEGTRNKSDNEQEMGEVKGGVVMFAHKTQSPIIPMLYYQRHKKFRKNYLIVGKPLYFEEELQQRFGLCKDEMLQKLLNAYAELRKTVNAYALGQCKLSNPNT